ncbi:hypothetical protein TELCIR_05378, partial [Teladorsagia circumcincta]
MEKKLGRHGPHNLEPFDRDRRVGACLTAYFAQSKDMAATPHQWDEKWIHYNNFHREAKLFLEKSGNHWKQKHNFKKLPGRMDLVETDFSDIKSLKEVQKTIQSKNVQKKWDEPERDKQTQSRDNGCANDTMRRTNFSRESAKPSTVVPGSKTTLHTAIKEILLMIFDKEQMESAMLSFQLDLDKMPLGKLSKRQITNAFKVLTDLQALCKKSEATTPGNTLLERNACVLVGAVCAFDATVANPDIPGLKLPIVTHRCTQFPEKCDMLGSLLEIQIAYEVLKQEQGDTEDTRDPVDIHYEKLKCKME